MRPKSSSAKKPAEQVVKDIPHPRSSRSSGSSSSRTCRRDGRWSSWASRAGPSVAGMTVTLRAARKRWPIDRPPRAGCGTVSRARSTTRSSNWRWSSPSYLLSAQQGFVLAMRNLARVQDALGFREAANSWIAQASATEQQQAIRQQQTNQAWAGAAYALGCALGGGCMNASPSRNYAKPSYTQPNPSTWMVTPQALPTSPSLCPNGQYVNGPCRMAPDGTFVGGSPRMAPDGTFVGGQPRMAPNGSYVGGDKVTMCPDGTYVGGSRCQLAPNGKYVGVD